MRLSPRLFRALGWCALVIGASAGPFVALAGLEGDEAAARGFFSTAVVGLFVGGLVLAGTARLTQPAGAAEALRLSFYAWVLTPLLAAPPLAAGAGGAIGGVFEAFSALTTTGAILAEPEQVSRSVVLWRCYLAWLGGLASLVLAATVFAALDRRGVGLRRTSLLTVERSDLFTNFGRGFRRLGAVYGLVTTLGAVLMMSAGAAPFDALCLALSGIATAGLSPQSGPLLDWAPPATVIALALVCLAGAWNFAVMYEWLSRYRIQRGTGELRAMAGVALGAGVAALLLAGPGAFPTGVLDGLFAISTAGFTASSGFAFPAVALFCLGLVGGATISTSGGVKMPRVLLLLRRAGGELSLLSHPSAAVRTRFGGRPVSDSALAGVWVYALAFPVALGVGAVMIALGGAEFGPAWRTAAASVTNMGPPAAADFAGLPPASLLASCVLMVAGRLEVMAAAAAVYVIFARD
ncbi:MAG: potassium transporter TrkG [Oceanicaulis sp.]